MAVDYSCGRRLQSSRSMTDALFNKDHDDAVKKLNAEGYTHEFNLTTGGGVVQTILQSPRTRRLVEIVSEDVGRRTVRERSLVREVRCLTLREAREFGGEEAPR